MTAELDGARGAHFVQSLERGLAVIRAFGADTPSLTLSEVARSRLSLACRRCSSAACMFGWSGAALVLSAAASTW